MSTTATTTRPTARTKVGGGEAPRVVFAHDFAESFGGAERIAAEIASLFPDAPFYAILGRRSVARRMGVEDRFHTLLPERERLVRNFRWLAPAYPALVRSRRLPDADVLVTSSFAFAHGLRTRNNAPQLCYLFSPLRFAWSMVDAYAKRMPGGRLAAAPFSVFAALMRAQDRRSARRVTRYVAESHHVAKQVERFYGRDAEVILPPVDCERFNPGGGPHDGYFVFCGRLVEPYKRPSLVVEAFRSLPGLRLLIAGDGPAMPQLRRDAPANVEFLGHLDDDDLVPLMQRCAAVIFPSRDDFGLVPVEVMACGRPVLAYAAGGALETVVAGETGEFFADQTVEAVREAVRRFDPDAYDPAAIRAHAELWDRHRFRAAMDTAIRTTAGGG
jgi:glycosyltransferase involved in cell wall biosynthesis